MKRSCIAHVRESGMDRSGCVSSRAAFTLVEMLVVIAIIGLLTSLMVPAISKSKSKAMNMNCQSNIRQCLVGLMDFALDHNSNVPVSYHPSTTSPGTWRSWAYVLHNTGYMQDYRSEQGLIKRRAYSCPLSVGRERQINNGQELIYGINEFCFTGQGEKSFYKRAEFDALGLWTFPGATSRITYITLLRVEQPASFVLLGESFSHFYHSRYNVEVQSPIIGGENSSMWLRHGDHANIGFADGHVGTLTRETGDRYFQAWKTWLLPDYYPPEN